MPLRVNVANGETSIEVVDLRLPGFIPLVLARTYHSGNKDIGLLGAGWSSTLDKSLQVMSDRIRYKDGSGQSFFFRRTEQGRQVVHEETGMLLQHHPDAFVVYLSPLVQHVFRKRSMGRGTISIDRIEDLNGNKIQFFYQESRLVGITDSAGRQLRFSYSGQLISSVQVASGQESATVRGYQHDVQGNLVGVTNATRHETRYAYDNQLMVSCTNRLSGSQYAQYDDKERCVALWNSDGSVVRKIEYDDLRQVTRVTGIQAKQSLYKHLYQRIVTEQIDPLAKSQHYYYDGGAFLGYATDKGTVGSLQKMDREALTLIQADGESRIATYTYNNLGVAESILDGYDNLFSLEYDDKANLNRLITMRGATWSFLRDERGQVKGISSPEGRKIRLNYSKGGRELTISDDLGLRFEAKYDPMGRLIERRDGMGRVQRFTYDPEGRLTTGKVDQGYEVRFTYDAEGNLTTVTDSRQRNEHMKYDAFSRLTSYTERKGGRWQFQYDEDGRLAAATNPQRQTAKFFYDWQGRLRKSVKFDGAAEQYLYVDDGYKVVSERTRKETSRHYSPLFELIREVATDGSERHFEYGPCGDLLSVAGPKGEVFFSYNEEGALSSVQSEDTQILFEYDQDGNLVSVNELAGSSLELKYDKRSRLVSLHHNDVLACEMQYDKGDRLSALTLANGNSFQFTYDPLDRLQERRSGGGHHPGDSVRFRSKESQAAKADWLSSASGHIGQDQEAAAWGVLLQSRNGMLLAAMMGEYQIPIWVQPHFFLKEETDLNKEIVLAGIYDATENLKRWAFPVGPDLLRQWEESIQHGIYWGYSEVPRAHEVGVPWMALNYYFLARKGYDAHYNEELSKHPDSQQMELGRSPDQALTGSHITGVLKNLAWNRRAIGNELDPTAAIHAGGGLSPHDALSILAGSQ